MVKKVLTLVFILITVLVAAGDALAAYEVYTYGTGDFVARAFTGLAMLTGSSGIVGGLLKLALIVGLLTFLFSVALPLIGGRASVFTPTGGEGIFVIIRQALLASIAVYLLMIPKTDVIINDKIEPSYNQVVQNVPLINALFAWAASQIGFKVGEAVDSVTADVDAIRFTKTGYLAGPKYIVELLEIQPPSSLTAGNVSVAAVLQAYYERCVFPPLAFVPGNGSPEAGGLTELFRSGYLPSAFGYYPFNNQGIILPISFKECRDNTTQCTDCNTAQTEIVTEWNTVMNDWFSNFNKRVGVSDSVAGQLISRYFPDVSRGDLLVQIATLNAVRGAFLAYSSFQGSTLPQDIGEKKVGSGWVQMSRLFDKVIITMRQIAEGVIYLLSAFLPVFFVVGGIATLSMFFKITMWLQLWVPLLVIVNNFADLALQKVVNNVLYAAAGASNGPCLSDGTLCFENFEAFKTQVNLVLGYIGAFSWSVPPLAWGLLKGGEYALSSAMSAMSGGQGGAQTAQQFGNELGAGNLSVGNQSLGNKSLLSSGFVGSMTQGQRQNGPLLDQGLGALMGWSGLGSGPSMGAGALEFSRGVGNYQDAMNRLKAIKWDTSTPENTVKGFAELARMHAAGSSGMYQMSGAEANQLWGEQLFNPGEMVRADFSVTPDGKIAYATFSGQNRSGGMKVENNAMTKWFSYTTQDGSTVKVTSTRSLSPGMNGSASEFITIEGGGFKETFSGNELRSVDFANIGGRFAHRLANALRDISSERLTHALTNSDKYSFSLSKLDSLSKTNQTAETISDLVQHALTDRILKDSSFKTVKSNETQDSLYASVSAGLSTGAPLKILGIQAGVGGGYELRAMNRKGEMLTFNISQSQAEDLTRTVGRTVSNTLSTLRGTTEGINEMKELARSINDTEAFNYMQNAEKLQSVSSEQFANLNTIAVKMVADEKFSHIADPVQRNTEAANYIARLASDPAKNQAELSAIYSKAMDSMMAQNPVTTEVTQKMDETKATLEQKGDEMKQKTDPAIKKVEKTTPHINPGNVGYTGKRPDENEIKRIDGAGFEERNRDYKNTIKNQEDPMGNFSGDAMVRPKDDPRVLVPDPGQKKKQLPPGPTGPIPGGPIKGSHSTLSIKPPVKDNPYKEKLKGKQ